MTPADDNVSEAEDQMNENENTEAEMNDEMSSNEAPEVNVNDVVDSWSKSEARQSELEKEVFELKQKLADSTSFDDDDDLDEDEIINKKVEAKLQAREAEGKFSTEQAERESNFLRKTNPFFRKNEKKVLETAIAAKVTITEAAKILKERENITKEAQKDTKGADTSTKGGSKGGNVRTEGGYDPKTDRGKSLEDLFRDNL